MQLKHACYLEKLAEGNHPIPSFAQDIASLRDKKLYITLMALPVAGIVIFNILPLVFMISMAFTTYSKEGNHLTLFDWTGWKNFLRVLNLKGNIGRQCPRCPHLDDRLGILRDLPELYSGHGPGHGHQQEEDTL